MDTDTSTPEPQIKKPRYISNLPSEESENQDDNEIEFIGTTPARGAPVII